MPKLLPARWRPDSIREFRGAARERFDDGLALAVSGRRAGAIYVWGYVAEMFLKASYFESIGIAPDARLTMSGDIVPAINDGRSIFAIQWPKSGEGHNVRAWAELLVAKRTALRKPLSEHAASMVQRCGQRIGEVWSVVLRYRRNVAYPHEVGRVRDSVDWLIENAERI